MRIRKKMVGVLLALGLLYGTSKYVGGVSSLEKLGSEALLQVTVLGMGEKSYVLRSTGKELFMRRLIEKSGGEFAAFRSQAYEKMEQENRRERQKIETFLVSEPGNVEKIEAGQEALAEKNTKETAYENKLVKQLYQEKDIDFLLDNFYIVDSTTSVDRSVFNVGEMLNKDYSIKKEKKPQILIYHTHGGTEYFAGGTKKSDSVVEVGTYLGKLLEETYGYQVIHDETKYDYINGKMDRNKAYTKALDAIQNTLENNPSIEVVIDLHRDGVNSKERKVTDIDGKSVAQFMIFNGLSRNQKGEIAYLKNNNLFDNLAFGLQVKLKAMERYPTLTTKNYLKGYRYNMHLKKRFLLIELGNQNNTVSEARNAMPYLAEVLDAVLSAR